MQRCYKCGQEKPEEEFSWKNRERAVRSGTCKLCQRAYRRQHYLNNKADYVARASAQMKRQRSEAQERVLQYLLDHPCVDCGESDPVVLQFDHQRDKTMHVSNMVSKGMTWRRIEAEMLKCEVRCANCHVRRTAKNFGYYRLNVSVV